MRMHLELTHVDRYTTGDSVDGVLTVTIEGGKLSVDSIDVRVEFFSLVRDVPGAELPEQMEQAEIISKVVLKSKTLEGVQTIPFSLKIPELLCSQPCYFDTNKCDDNDNPLAMRKVSAHNHDVPPTFCLMTEKSLKAEVKHFVRARARFDRKAQYERRPIQVHPHVLIAGNRTTTSGTEAQNIKLTHAKTVRPGTDASVGLAANFDLEHVVHSISLNLVCLDVYRTNGVEQINLGRKLLRSSGDLNQQVTSHDFSARFEDFLVPVLASSFSTKTLERIYAYETVFNVSKLHGKTFELRCQSEVRLSAPWSKRTTSSRE